MPLQTPPTPTFQCPVPLFAPEFLSQRCERHSAALLRSRGCSRESERVRGRAGSWFLIAHTSCSENFQDRTQERGGERQGKKLGLEEAREGQEGRGDTAVS